MKNALRILVRVVLAIVLIFLVYMVVVIAQGTINDYQPEEEIVLEADQSSSTTAIADSVLSFFIWNIGYGGLGEESDFFYEDAGMLFSGSSMVHAPKEAVDKNVKGVYEVVKQTKSDFFLLQEVDRNSKRSYYTNEYEGIQGILPDYSAYFGLNYKVDRVPLPVMEPWYVYGRVNSGIASLSRFQPQSSKRIQLPGEYDWITRIFQLDRCLLVQRYPHQNGKELVVINLHNSAYDKGGVLKKQQMEALQKLLLAEYEKGNYVIAGGDWNQCPPFFKFDSFIKKTGDFEPPINIDPDFLPEGWLWVYDASVPTNRNIKDPFVYGKTFVTLIDFFLISPNIRVLKAKGLRQNFKFSDHQPVWMEVELL